MPSIVISGSFRKHLPDIGKLRDEFMKLGFEVLSPQSSTAVNPDPEFVILTSDDTKDIKTLEQKHLDCITRADAILIYNPNGEIGMSATLELGWAHALGKRIFAKEVPTDITLRQFCIAPTQPSEINKQLSNKESHLEKLSSHASLGTLQQYIHDVVIERGFADESTRDILLLMIEEVGELAKAVRKYSGIKVDAAKAEKYALLKEELADVFIYLLDLANTLKIDLFTAFHEKEQKNSQRSWKISGG